MPKNVGIEVHLKDSKVSQTSSNYIVLKMSEKVAAGRSWEITLSSSVKWSHCLVSFFRAALWNTASSNLKVTWRIRQRVFRRKVWPCPFASMCKSMDKKRWKMTLHVSQRTSACSSSLLKGEEGPWGSCAGSLHSSGAWCHALRFNSGIGWQPEQPGCQKMSQFLHCKCVPLSKSWCSLYYRYHCIWNKILRGYKDCPGVAISKMYFVQHFHLTSAFFLSSFSLTIPSMQQESSR